MMAATCDRVTTKLTTKRAIASVAVSQVSLYPISEVLIV